MYVEGGNLSCETTLMRMSRAVVMVSVRPCWYPNITSLPSRSFGLCATRCTATSGKQIIQFSISDVQKGDLESEGDPDLRMVCFFGMAVW